jgi:hypothetical protein
MCPVHALSKTPPKNPVGKKGRRKECIARASRIALVASVKTLHEKTQWEKKTHQGKKSTTIDAQVKSLGPTCDLQDHKHGL